MGMGSSPQVHPTVVNISTIKPLYGQNTSADPKVINPTFMDKMITDFFVQTIFAYRLEENSEDEYSRFITRVKDSLQRVLVRFYPFAGWWFAHEHYGRQLVCNGEGVPFVEAALLEEDVDSVIRASGGFRPVAGLHGYEALGYDQSKQTLDMTSRGLPSLFVQVSVTHQAKVLSGFIQKEFNHIPTALRQATRFKCGGVVLGVTFNHMLCDGRSFFDFMESWAEMGRTDKVTIQPNFDRSLSDPFKSARTDLQVKNEKPNHRDSKNGTAKLSSLEHHSPPILISKTYEVKLSSISAMKLAVSESKKKGAPYVSTVDCILAHAWKCLYELPDSVLEEGGLYVCNAIEGRNRFFDPPLPNLLGNVVSRLVCPPMPPEEITSKATHELAQIHRAKLLGTKPEDWYSEERIAEVMRASTGKRQFVLSSWYSFPLYDIDFGVGGRPYFSPGANVIDSAKTGTTNLVAACTVAPPVPARSSFSAAIATWVGTQEFLTALESTPSFLSLFLT